MSIIRPKNTGRWRKDWAGRGLKLAELMEHGVNYAKVVIGDSTKEKTYKTGNGKKPSKTKKKEQKRIEKIANEESSQLAKWVLENAKSRDKVKKITNGLRRG